MTSDEKANILMVDDQPGKLLSYEVILAELGENLIKATSASEALNILLKTDVAVVLMDVSMPDVDGFELAAVIRQHPRFQKTAIIFISGVHLTDSDRIQGYRSGAVDYISVPVVPEVLRAKIGVFVELHRKTRMLETLNLYLKRRVIERTEELRKSEMQFRMRAELLEVASEAIMVRDAGGRIQFWNSGAENLYGWSRQEAIGRDLHILLQTVFPVPTEEIHRALEEQRRWQGNLIQKTRNGTEIVVACRKSINHEGDAVLEVIRDITVQLQAEQALRETEKLAAMGRVAGIIAHEINNPLAAVTNLFICCAVILRSAPKPSAMPIWQNRNWSASAISPGKRSPSTESPSFPFPFKSMSCWKTCSDCKTDCSSPVASSCARSSRFRRRCADFPWSCDRYFSTSSAMPSRPCLKAARLASACARPQIGPAAAAASSSPSSIPERAFNQGMRDGSSSLSSLPSQTRERALDCGSARVLCRNTKAGSASAAIAAPEDAPRASVSFCPAVAQPMRPSIPPPIRSRQTTRGAKPITTPR